MTDTCRDHPLRADLVGEGQAYPLIGSALPQIFSRFAKLRKAAAGAAAEGEGET